MADLASPSLLRLLMLVLVFLLVGAGAFLVLSRAQTVNASRRALRALGRPEGGSASQAELVQGRRLNTWSKLVRMVEASGLNLQDSKPDAVRQKLAAAGFTAPDASRIYTLVRLALIFLVPAVLVGGVLFIGAELTAVKGYLLAAFGAVLGLFIPKVYLDARTDRRTTEITNGFPNCLDLMLVCVESGLGLEAAFDRVGREMAEAEPLVSELLIGAVLALRAGATREDALRGMAAAVHVPEVRSFCTLLIQSDKLGTSIGSTLRVYAAEMRERRRMRAEEKAHRLPIIISIPLVMCMLPVMLGVLMLPALIMVLRRLMPAMMGG